MPENYWDGSDSDLTELTSDEEEEAPPANASSSKKTSSARASTKRATAESIERTHTGNPCLKPPRTCNYAVQMVYGWIVDKTLNLDPEYQRDVVWNDAKQSNLIDSLFNNFPVPPLIFANKMARDGSMKRTCIDGKQRLTSIQRFVDGEIPHRDSVTNKKTWYKNAPKQRRVALSRDLKNTFDGKQITCVEYDDLVEDQEREIFQRVQMGVSLTPAERLAAINGHYATVVRDMQAALKESFADNFGWGTARGKDFQSVAQIIFLIDSDKLKPLEPTIARLEPFLSKKTDEKPIKLQNAVRSVCDIFCRIAHGESTASLIWNQGRMAPMELVMTCYLISVYRNKLSDMQLANAICHMRQDIRQFNSDIRFNNKAYKHTLDFIVTKLKKVQLQSDGKNDVPAAKVVAVEPSLAAKRKWEAHQEEEEEEPDDDVRFIRKKVKPASRAKSLTSKLRTRINSDDEDSDAFILDKAPKSRLGTAARASIVKGLRVAAGSSSVPVASGQTKVKRTAPPSTTKPKSAPAMKAKPSSSSAGPNSRIVTPSSRPNPKARIGAGSRSESNSTSAPPTHTPSTSQPASPVASTSALPDAAPTKTVPIPRKSNLVQRPASASHNQSPISPTGAQLPAYCESESTASPALASSSVPIPPSERPATTNAAKAHYEPSGGTAGRVVDVTQNQFVSGNDLPPLSASSSGGQRRVQTRPPAQYVKKPKLKLPNFTKKSSIPGSSETAVAAGPLDLDFNDELAKVQACLSPCKPNTPHATQSQYATEPTRHLASSVSQRTPTESAAQREWNVQGQISVQSPATTVSVRAPPTPGENNSPTLLPRVSDYVGVPICPAVQRPLPSPLSMNPAPNLMQLPPTPDANTPPTNFLPPPSNLSSKGLSSRTAPPAPTHLHRENATPRPTVNIQVNGHPDRDYRVGDKRPRSPGGMTADRRAAYLHNEPVRPGDLRARDPRQRAPRIVYGWPEGM
ncbi:hypothetical protein BDQ12DRAFT_109364 [Crucibulum laeve]|uniref:GmrSD restriction endonucleases N-terminal domain-containing protein n=1 Tax=Crucibulum laeve TaxID=68775 RepID=A0A5C3M054_9AGAR|nr:hypothetical protein BDQ12DRAFT_109364 [Crucibulum laeve]